jgi:hypothetical protein
MRRSKAVDAKQDTSFMIRQCHWKNGKPFNPQSCAGALAAKSAGYKDYVVLRNVVLLQKPNGKWLRYMAGGALKVIAAMLDTGNRNSVKLPKDGIRIVLHAPTGVRTQKYLRSAKMKATRAASTEKNKGKQPRLYRRTDGLSYQDIRHGRGKAWV